MGRDLGEIFYALSIEMTWLSWRWQQYKILFGGKQNRLDILNGSAPFFFFVIQETLWHETLLGISRLAGPSKSAGKKNLAVRRAISLVADDELLAEMEPLVETMDQACAFALDWRNRHIAHRDLDVALKRSATPLPPATQDEVDAAIDSIAAILNRIQLHYEEVTTAYGFAGTIHDAEDLLYVLRDGLRRREIRQQKLDDGEYDPKDWDDDLPAV